MPRQCRLADVVETQMSSLEGFDIEHVLWKIYAQVPRVNALSGFTIFFISVFSWTSWLRALLTCPTNKASMSIFYFFTWFCLLFDVNVHVCPMTPNKSKGIAEKVWDCEDAIYPFGSVMSPKHVCLRTVRYWLSPPTAAARRLARSVSEISRRKGAASQHSRALELQALLALQSTRATSSAALPALQNKRRREESSTIRSTPAAAIC